MTDMEEKALNIVKAVEMYRMEDVIHIVGNIVIIMIAFICICVMVEVLLKSIHSVVESKRISETDRRMMITAIDNKINYLQSIVDIECLSNSDEVVERIIKYGNLRERLIRKTYKPQTVKRWVNRMKARFSRN